MFNIKDMQQKPYFKTRPTITSQTSHITSLSSFTLFSCTHFSKLTWVLMMEQFYIIHKIDESLEGNLLWDMAIRQNRDPGTHQNHCVNLIRGVYQNTVQLIFKEHWYSKFQDTARIFKYFFIQNHKQWKYMCVSPFTANFWPSSNIT